MADGLSGWTKRSAVNHWRNTAGDRARSWQRFSALGRARVEGYRARVFGRKGFALDATEAKRVMRWSLAEARRLPKPRLP